MKLFLQNLLGISLIFIVSVLAFTAGMWLGSLVTNREDLQVYAGIVVTILPILALGITIEERE